MNAHKQLFCLVLLCPVLVTGQIKGYRTIEKLRYALADSVNKGKGLYYPLAPIGVFGDSTVTDVYTNGAVFLHDLAYQFTSQVNNIELVSEYRHHYLVYAKDSSYGYDWNGYNELSLILQRIRIDSLLDKTWKNGFISAYEARLPMDSFNLVASSSDPNSGILTELYKPFKASDTCLGTKLYFKYSKDESKGIPAPARLPGMYITDIVATIECVPSKFELSFHLQPVNKITETIAQIFQAYIDGKLEIMTSGISTMGPK